MGKSRAGGTYGMPVLVLGALAVLAFAPLGDAHGQADPLTYSVLIKAELPAERSTTLDLNVPDDVAVNHVDFTMYFSDCGSKNLVELVSPAGTGGQYLQYGSCDDDDVATYRLSPLPNLAYHGESSAGTWQLRITQGSPSTVHNGYSLSIYASDPVTTPEPTPTPDPRVMARSADTSSAFPISITAGNDSHIVGVNTEVDPETQTVDSVAASFSASPCGSGLAADLVSPAGTLAAMSQTGCDNGVATFGLSSTPDATYRGETASGQWRMHLTAGAQDVQVSAWSIVLNFPEPPQPETPVTTPTPDPETPEGEEPDCVALEGCEPPADTTPPVIVGIPPDITAQATSSAGAVVTFTTPTATDAVDGSIPVTSSHASGSTFPVGSTTVTFTATDSAGNTATRSFTITITPLPVEPAEPYFSVREPAYNVIPGDIADTYDFDLTISPGSDGLEWAHSCTSSHNGSINNVRDDYYYGIFRNGVDTHTITCTLHSADDSSVVYDTITFTASRPGSSGSSGTAGQQEPSDGRGSGSDGGAGGQSEAVSPEAQDLMDRIERLQERLADARERLQDTEPHQEKRIEKLNKMIGKIEDRIQVLQERLDNF